MSSPTPPKQDTSPNRKPKELSNEVRMVLAFVLMGLILVGTPFVYKKLGLAPPDPAKSEQGKTDAAKTDASKTDAAKTDPAKTDPTKTDPAKAEERSKGGSTSGASASQISGNRPAAGGTSSAPANAISAAKPEEFTVETRLYRVVFSNAGATVRSWTLKNFKDSTGKPLEIVNEPGAAKLGLYPFSLEFRGTKPTHDLNKVLWVGRPSPDGRSISYEYSDGRTAAKKTFSFENDGYMVQVSDDVTLDGRGIPSLFEWRGGFGDMAVQNAAGQQATIHYDTQNRKLIRTAAKSAKDGPQVADGPFSFAGLDDQYFTAAFLPPASSVVQTTTFDDQVSTPFNKGEEPYPGVAVGGEAHNQLPLYVGAKELSALHRVNPKLEDIVDWGWFGIIAKPLFLVLHWMNDQFVHNYGWSIILLTIIINLVLFPLKLANLKSMRKMQLVQPEINRINEKYKGVSMSDPRAQQKQQEIMDLHKKHGVNPLGGCIPLLIQLPFLWAFYKVLTVSIELRYASWLWVTDLSQPEHTAIRVLPLILVATGFLLQKMTPATGGDPQQQKMMQFMPLMWGFFFWSASSGLVLYWLTGNLVGIAQQWFFNKTAVPAVEVTPAPKKLMTKDGRKRA